MKRNALVACIGLVVLSPFAHSQDTTRSAPLQRPGGIPRNSVPPEAQRNQGAGTEEGIPQIKVAPTDSKVTPRWVPPPSRQWKLGVYAYYGDTGATVTQVAPNSPAQRAGLERGDLIVSVNGYQIGWIMDYLYPLDAELQRQAGFSGQVRLLVQNVRNRQLLNLDVRLTQQQPRSSEPAPRLRQSEPASPSQGVTTPTLPPPK